MTIDNLYGGTVAGNQLSKAPTKTDIKQTKRLLQDFCIAPTIPQFATLTALLYWKKEKIIAKPGKMTN